MPNVPEHPCDLTPDGFCLRRTIFNIVISACCPDCLLPVKFGAFTNLDTPPRVSFGLDCQTVYIDTKTGYYFSVRNGILTVLSTNRFPIEDILARFIESRKTSRK